MPKAKKKQLFLRNMKHRHFRYMQKYGNYCVIIGLKYSQKILIEYSIMFTERIALMAIVDMNTNFLYNRLGQLFGWLTVRDTSPNFLKE